MMPSLKNKVFSSPLSAMPLVDCLAKTYASPCGRNLAGRTVLDHCTIVGEVARSMVARIPTFLRGKFFPEGVELVAGAHDIGKVSPTFQEKIYRAIDGYEANSRSELKNIAPVLEKNWGGHAGVSQACVNSPKFEVGKYIPEILGRHHGYDSNREGHSADAECFGGQAWQERREELLFALKENLKVDWPNINDRVHAKILSGLTTVADWIGSSSSFENPAEPWREKIKIALDEAGFIAPVFKAGLNFSAIFNFNAHSAQQKLIEAVTGPGVYIFEAPMGLGKTEAALFAAYKVLEQGQATGLYFALPTQLTSNKIHERADDFLKKILIEESIHKNSLLLHSNAWLEKDLGVDAAPGGSWFNSSKRGILAPFAVGTIDQALMAVMNVKHGFVRAFGLAGKVVVLDEVHSYDAYTGTILEELVNELRALECTVIILSATLTQERREKLLGQVPIKSDYPLVSAISRDNILHELSVDKQANNKVKISLCYQDLQAIDEVLKRAEEGQQILWIENTVQEAQNFYKLLAAKSSDLDLDLECGLLHSRFIKEDRSKNESHWVGLYGKNNSSERQKKGRILVGTQVLEQSLDIDADFLITRICPMDMVLQRLGRLWRHEKTVRPKLAKRESWILTPRLKEAYENPEKSFGKTAKVYAPYVLIRSLEVLENRDTISLPGDIRGLIEATYQERSAEENREVSELKSALKKERDRLKNLALVGVSYGGKCLPEEKASTRYAEQENIDVFLFKKYTKSENPEGVFVVLLNDEEIFLPANPKSKDKKKWRSDSALLMRNTVRVPEHLAPASVSKKKLSGLKDYFYLGDFEDEKSLLRVAQLMPGGDLKSLEEGTLSQQYFLSYDEKLGYHSDKNQGEIK